MDNIIKNYICVTPFIYLEAHKNGVFSCCPSWLPNKISSLEDIENVWESKELKEVQDSILDGSYKFCSKTQCPYLSELINQNTIPQGFVKKEKFNYREYIDGPQNVNFAFDRSCNLSCPSCRLTTIMADGTEVEFVTKNIEKIVNKFGQNISTLYLSGSADPFASKSIRNFLLKFDINKFPKLNKIHLHTNGLLLNQKMWNNLSHIHHLIKTIEISVDAAEKDTYEIVRRGGDWETIISNLKFISTLNLNDVRISFVVQDTNYMEIGDFYNLMMNIFNKKVNVYFNKITNWGTYTDDEYKTKQIWDENHPEFNLFLIQLNKINKKYKCIHNMYDIIDKHLSKKFTQLI